MREGLRGTGRARQIHETRGEFAAIQAALESLAPGDLLLCQVDQVEQALEFVQEWFARFERATRRERRATQVRASGPLSPAPLRGAALRP